MIKRMLTAPFRFIWWVLTIPYRLFKVVVTGVIGLLLYPFRSFGIKGRDRKLLARTDNEISDDLCSKYFHWSYSRGYTAWILIREYRVSEDAAFKIVDRMYGRSTRPSLGRETYNRCKNEGTYDAMLEEFGFPSGEDFTEV